MILSTELLDSHPVTNDCNAFIRKCNVRPGPRCQGQFGVLSSLLCVGAGYSDNPNKRLRDDKRACLINYKKNIEQLLIKESYDLMLSNYDFFLLRGDALRHL